MIVVKGNFNKIEKFLNKMTHAEYLNILDRYGQEGVEALSAATPIDSSNTANSWGYRIQRFKGSARIVWTNSNVVDGVPVVILLQYGHATRNGGYVQGNDFINPTLKPIFDKIANDVWMEVSANA